jgi:hypothetical protein
MVFLNFSPPLPLNGNVLFFLQVLFFESHPVYDQTEGSGVVFSLHFRDNSSLIAQFAVGGEEV